MVRHVRLILDGGIGNQLHSIAAGYLLAKLTDRKLSVDTTLTEFEPRLSTPRSGLRQLDLEADLDIPIRIGSWPRDWMRRLERKVLGNYEFYFPEGDYTIEGADLIKRFGPYFLSAHYERSWFPVQAKKLGFPERLRLKEPSESFLTVLDRVQEGPSIGVHVRLGDFREWLGGTQLMSESYYQSSTRLLREMLPGSTVWLFSDEISTAQQVMGGVKNLVPVSENLGLSDVEEMMLLAHMTGLVLSKSSFSWWAAFMNTSSRTVISPHGPGWCLPAWQSPDGLL